MSMDKLQKIKKETEFNRFLFKKDEGISLAFNLKEDDFKWLIQEIERLHTIEQAYSALRSAL